MSTRNYQQFESVWDALESDPAVAENLKLRSALMIAITEWIRTRGWTQTVAAKHCGIAQPRLNDLLRGKIDRFSLDALVNIAAALGLRVDMTIRAA
jgi:predicted XRE-type DNA-binding protein